MFSTSEGLQESQGGAKQEEGGVNTQGSVSRHFKGQQKLLVHTKKHELQSSIEVMFKKCVYFINSITKKKTAVVCSLRLPHCNLASSGCNGERDPGVFPKFTVRTIVKL